MTLDSLSMRMPTLKIEKFIYMSDGFYVHKTQDGYSVSNEHGHILKSAKTLKTCDNYVQTQLIDRRAAERYAIEKINQDQVQNRSI